jgi:microcystin-dependent protein
MDSYTGTVMLWSVSWVPDGWLACNGQLLQVNQYQALFSLIGNQYGGDGNTTFAIPNLAGRVAVGLSPLFPYAKFGGDYSSQVTIDGTATGSFTLGPNQIPPHTHGIPQNVAQVNIPANNTTSGNTNTPGPTAVLSKGTVPVGPGAAANIYSTATPNTNLPSFNATVPASTTGSTGSSAAIQLSLNIYGAAGDSSTIQPWAALYYIICVNGIYPPRP